ncbi:MAG TPA: hypothetical protein VHM88_11595 [Candidatus Acidoferrales bacterium]|jgi:hypothetical protein|nr:hypothetical protein [Candidatus Dormibacteraeota bacterium]HEX2712853.1 hypothetical protein [Candidatus Acidoferrales bacterium]
MATMTVNSILDQAPSQAPPAANPDAPRETIPLYIDVEYWTEDDGSWGAHAPLLGVSATADSEAQLFAEMVGQVDEFWQVLNGRYETLSQELKRILELRGLGLRFINKA